MFVIRPSRSSDLDALYKLACKAGAGLTTLPADRELLAEKLQQSLKTFSYPPKRPSGESFLFVLEDMRSGEARGTSACYTKVGGFQPFWTYEVKSQKLQSQQLGVENQIQYLQVKREHDGPSEIGTLFLDPDLRGSWCGRLLSLIRFVFMAQFRNCFENEVLAELRGRIDINGRSPFWDSVGAHFFGCEFAKADALTCVNKQFIDELFPKHPLYVPLLPRGAQVVIGMVHDDSRPAMRLLESEGFKVIPEVDIFEGGPIVKAKTDDIRCIRDSRVRNLLSLLSPIEEQSLEAAQAPLNIVACGAEPSQFRAIVTSLVEDDEGLRLPLWACEALSVRPGDLLRFVSLRQEAKR